MIFLCVRPTAARLRGNIVDNLFADTEEITTTPTTVVHGNPTFAARKGCASWKDDIVGHEGLPTRCNFCVFLSDSMFSRSTVIEDCVNPDLISVTGFNHKIAREGHASDIHVL